MGAYSITIFFKATLLSVVILLGSIIKDNSIFETDKPVVSFIYLNKFCFLLFFKTLLSISYLYFYLKKLKKNQFSYRYFYRFFAFVLFRQIFVSFNKEIPLTKVTVCFIIRNELKANLLKDRDAKPRV